MHSPLIYFFIHFTSQFPLPPSPPSHDPFPCPFFPCSQIKCTLPPCHKLYNGFSGFPISTLFILALIFLVHSSQYLQSCPTLPFLSLSPWFKAKSSQILYCEVLSALIPRPHLHRLSRSFFCALVYFCTSLCLGLTAMFNILLKLLVVQNKKTLPLVHCSV